MATAVAVTPEDVALELVATKMALQQIIWNLSGTTSEPDGFAEWVHRSPVPLPVHGFRARLDERADAIEVEMMEAAGNWLLGIVRSRRNQTIPGEISAALDEMSNRLRFAVEELSVGAPADAKAELQRAIVCGRHALSTLTGEA